MKTPEVRFCDPADAIEEAIFRRYNGESKRHFVVIQRGAAAVVREDRGNRHTRVMWSTRAFTK